MWTDCAAGSQSRVVPIFEKTACFGAALTSLKLVAPPETSCPDVPLVDDLSMLLQQNQGEGHIESRRLIAAPTEPTTSEGPERPRYVDREPLPSSQEQPSLVLGETINGP